MKKPVLLLALGLCTALNSAYADTYDAVRTGDGYQFSNAISADSSFEDYIAFSTDGLQNIVASISGTAGNAFTFESFNLLDSNKNLIATGSVFNAGSDISFGSIKSNQNGEFYLQVIGSSVGITAGYNGTITTTAVPEPESYALLLAGLGLVGVLGRKKVRENA